jgi:hypothetical protein
MIHLGFANGRDMRMILVLLQPIDFGEILMDEVSPG